MSISQFVFVLSQVEDYWNILKLNWRQHAFTTYEAFLKNKKSSGISLFASYLLHDFWRKIFLFWWRPDQISLFGCLYFIRYLATFWFCNCLLTNLWSHKFWSNHFFIIKPNVFIIFRGLSLNQIKQVFLEGESPTLKQRLFCQALYGIEIINAYIAIVKMASFFLFSIITGIIKFCRTFVLQIRTMELHHRCFPENFAKYFRTAYLKNTF